MSVIVESIKITDVNTNNIFLYSMGSWSGAGRCTVGGLVTYIAKIKNTTSSSWNVTVKLDDTVTGNPFIPTLVATLPANSYVEHVGSFVMPNNRLYLIAKVYVGNSLLTQSITLAPFGVIPPDPAPDPTPDPTQDPIPDYIVKEWGNDPISLAVGAGWMLALAVFLDKQRKK